MLNILLVPTTIIYILAVSLLFVYGVNFFYMTYLAIHLRRPPVIQPILKTFPPVTIQLPIYNELYVAKRLVMAASRLDYPRDLLEIQVLDDSTDETAIILQKTVKELQEQGFKIRYLHRNDRKGYKAGALAEGLNIAEGEFLAIFDSDFVPTQDFLVKTLPLFVSPQIAFVQTRWGHLNQDYSLLTRLQSLAIDAHFIVEQQARSGGGYWFNFNGTAGIWRKAAIVDAGGWKADTLTEDLDLSYRSFLRGWKAAYLREVEVPAELPASFNAYRRQQQRWARGSFECVIKLLPAVLRTRLPLAVKLESALHLSGYGVHLLLFTLSILYPLVLLLIRQHPGLMSLMGLAFIFNATAFAPTIFFVAAQKQAGRNWVKQLPAILFMTVMGCGMMVNTVQAALQVLFKRPARFDRTPKYGVEKQQDDWMERKKYHLKMNPIVFFEITLAIWNFATVWLAIGIHNWGIAFYAVIFATGLLFVAFLTIFQTVAVHQRSPEPVLLGE